MKRINIFVLLCVGIFGTCTGTWAVDVYNFESFKSALTNPPNDDYIITLNSDISITDRIEVSIDKHVTIDLNNHNIATTRNIGAFWFQAGYVTIKGNGTISSPVETSRQKPEGACLIIVGNGRDETKGKGDVSLTVTKDVTINSYYRQGIGVWGTNISAPELIFSGKLELFNVLANGISNSGSSGNTPTRIVINPYAQIIVGNLEDTAAGIYHPGSGDLEIYGGVIEGPSAIEMKGGSLYIEGDDFKATATNKLHKAYANGSSTGGYAIALVANKAYNHAGRGVKNKDVTIKGGTFEGLIEKINDGEATETVDGKGNAEQRYGGGTYDPEITITGGVFAKENIDSEHKAEFEKWLEDNYETVDKSDGEYFTVRSESSPISDVSIDPGTGKIDYELKDGEKTTLFDVINEIPYEELLKSDPVLEIKSDISDINDILGRNPNWEVLDLTDASGLENTTAKLQGIAIPTIIMNDNTKITEMILDEASDIKTINGAGAINLTSLTLGKNQNIETIDISGSSVTTIDATGCKNLKKLDVSNTETLTTLVLDDCEALEELDCSGNGLFFLDLSKLNLDSDKVNLSAQKIAKKDILPASTTFDILGLITRLLGGDSSKAAAIAKNIVEVSEGLVGTRTPAKYDPLTGIATFDSVPTNSVRYFYDTRGALASVGFIASVAEDVDVADAENYIMDVQISEGADDGVNRTPKGGSGNSGRNGSGDNDGSGGGCNSIRSEAGAPLAELGVRSFLLMIALFALMFMKFSLKR